MRRRLRALFPIVALAFVSSSCDSTSAENAVPSDPNASDDAEIRGLLERIGDAWARGDATAYAALHTPDAHVIEFRGAHVVGRQAIVDFFQPAFDTVLKNTSVEANIVALRFLSPSAAVMHTVGQIVPTGDRSIQTFVVTKGDEGWRVAAFQNTRQQDR